MTLKIKKKRLQQNGVGMLREKQGYYLSFLPLTLSVTKKHIILNWEFSFT